MRLSIISNSHSTFFLLHRTIYLLQAHCRNLCDDDGVQYSLCGGYKSQTSVHLIDVRIQDLDSWRCSTGYMRVRGSSFQIFHWFYPIEGDRELQRCGLSQANDPMQPRRWTNSRQTSMIMNHMVVILTFDIGPGSRFDKYASYRLLLVFLWTWWCVSTESSPHRKICAVGLSCTNRGSFLFYPKPHRPLI